MSRVKSPASWTAVAVLVTLVGAGFSRTVIAQKYTFEDVAAGLKHQDASTRLRAIQILKDADYADAAEPIAATLEDPDDRVQVAAIDAERSLFTTRPVSRRRKVGFVVEVRSVSGDAAEGQLALKARAVPPQVMHGLAVALRDGNPRVRADAINLAALLAPVACGHQVRLKPDPTKMPDPTKVGGGRQDVGGGRLQADPLCDHVGNALVDNINSREPLLRRNAMLALGQLRYANAVQALSDQLSYYQKGADAAAAAEGLAGIGHPTSASVFRQLLTNSNAGLRRLAVEGLARADQADALGDLQQMAANERSNGVMLSLHYAGLTLRAPGSTPQPIIAALRDSSLRPLALRYLLDLAPSMASALAESLRDEDPDVRRLVAHVLGFSRDPRIVAQLDAATKDADPDVAAAAQQAIERIKIP